MAVLPHGHPEREENKARFLEGNHPEVPDVVYHGTGDDFAEFRHDHPNKKDKGWLGKGFYFTNSPPLASSYALLKRGEDKNVMPVHVALKNPFFATQEHKEALRYALMDDPFAADDFREKLIRAGHDGVILDYGTPDGGKEVVAFHPTQIKSATGNQGTFDPENPDITKATGGEVEDEGITAYHGSPHDYLAERLVQYGDGRTEYLVGSPNTLPAVPEGATSLQEFPLGRMRLDKIGTGEGAQAYGHGLYTAEAEPIAKHYRDVLSRNADQWTVDGTPISKLHGSTDMVDDLRYQIGLAGRQGKSTQKAMDWVELQIRGRLDSKRTQPEELPYLNAQLKALEGMRAAPPEVKGGGHMYEVRINAHPDHFADWDRPIVEQPHVIKALGADWDAMKELHSGPSAMPGYPDPNKMTVGDFIVGGSMKAQTAKLRDAGIPGIRYLDANSRGAGEGSRNYVVFDDKLVDVKKKYADGGVVKESDDGKEARKDRNPHDHGRSGRKTPLIIDRYPTRYMPHVGRQVMADGGQPSTIVKRALELASVGRRGRQRGRP